MFHSLESRAPDRRVSPSGRGVYRVLGYSDPPVPFHLLVLVSGTRRSLLLLSSKEIINSTRVGTSTLVHGSLYRKRVEPKTLRRYTL